MNKYSERIESLRALMRGRGWDAVVIYGSDPHQSEYPAPRWKQPEWLTGFTGEAAEVVVTLDHAGLWTDTRYFIQAEKQLEGTGVVLHKTRVPDEVLIPEWLEKEFDRTPVIAVDGLCQSCDDAKMLRDFSDLVSVPNLLDLIWKDRPAIPQTPVFRVESGSDTGTRIDALRRFVNSEGCDSILISRLDDIAWLLNVRGSDIEYNPLVISYLLVGLDYIKWYVIKDEEEDLRTAGTFRELREEGVEILPYEDIYIDLKTLSDNLILDFSSLNNDVFSLIDCPFINLQSPVSRLKAIKNSFEVESMRSCHIDDGVAMEKFLYWLEKSLASDKIITEWDAAVKLGNYRAEIEDYQGDSFETISAYGAGAALPHYVTPKTDSPVLEPHGLYLCDSGGQYLRGTTDITRTVPLGECSEEEAVDYTLVLKGHIDLAMAQFPEGTPGCRIDAIARMPLWKAGRNFGHGTGHGVGFFLGVHEGPQDIRQNLNPTPLESGMITSDEPGIYREGKHGVRHENLILTKEAGETEFGRFLCFEPLTLCHFDTSIIVAELLDKEEIEWLDNYNATVYFTLKDRLSPDVQEWLKAKTAPLNQVQI